MHDRKIMVDREATYQWLVKLANILNEEEKTGDEITFRNLKAFHSRILAVMALLLDLPAEPCVMELEDLQPAPKADVWLEYAEKVSPASWVMTEGNSVSFYCHGFIYDGRGITLTLHFDDYGKNWRCWTANPTDAQREAVVWKE